ncbi:hypothetical protein F2Q69_00028236 [Brassica cretica]|uniref:Uncharacterized protein n=1 Tax=Brassica cretica TaxID=69181 RepID=A0A8S9S5F3_BRACR|nr:hypothetical protein F2Q69_00028236 [Brassica cretica]
MYVDRSDNQTTQSKPIELIRHVDCSFRTADNKEWDEDTRVERVRSLVISLGFMRKHKASSCIAVAETKRQSVKL